MICTASLFKSAARKLAGHQLHLVQLGLDPDDWKPMPSIGAGVQEIRIHTGVEHRVSYVAKFTEGVYVLHAFEKRTQRTRQADLDSRRAQPRASDLVRGKIDLFSSDTLVEMLSKAGCHVELRVAQPA